MNGCNSRCCDVLFLIRSMGRGGAERQLSLLARALHVRGLRVAVAVFYSGGALEAELHEAGVEVIDLQKGGRWSGLGTIRRLMAVVCRRRPHVLHSYMPAQNVLALLLGSWLARRGCAVVCGIRVASLDSWQYGVVAWLVNIVQRMLLSRADCVISNSARGLKELESRIAPGCGFAIPNGVEWGRFNFSAEARLNLRAKWRVQPEGIAIGLVGRLDPQKNHCLLIDALQLLRRRRPEAIAVFVGDGSAEYKARLQARIQAAGLSAAVHWVGHTDDLVGAYSAIDILCLSSVAEGFPNVLAEAMCAGLPCVTTDVGDAVHLVGDCGWVVAPNDANALGSALEEEVESLPRWDRARPRLRMIQHFSVEVLADRTISALGPLLRSSA